MGISIASGIARFFGTVKGTVSKKAPVKASSEAQRNAAASLREGYTRHEIQGASIYTADVSEASYFEEEQEFAPTIMAVEPAQLPAANSAHTRRVSRFEDPADEFTNAGPRASRTEIDYSVFNVRSAPAEEPADIFSAAAPVEVPVEETTVSEQPAEEPIIITPVMEQPSEAPVAEAPAVETIEIPAEPVAEEVPEVTVVEIPAAPVAEAAEAPVAEVPAVETPAVETIEIPAEPVAEETAEVSAEPVIVEQPSEEVEYDTSAVEEEAVVGASEESMSPAEEIAASTSVFGGMAGVVGVMETSVSIPRPVYNLRLDDECEFVRAFDDKLDGDVNDYYDTQNIDEILPLKEDGMEEMLAEALEMEETDAIAEALAMESIKKASAPAVEPVPETVEAPAIEEEVVLAPVEEESAVEIPAIEETVEAPIEEEPAVEIPAIEETVEAPAEETVEAPAVETVLSLPAPETPICLAPVPEEEPVVVASVANCVEAPSVRDIIDCLTAEPVDSSAAEETVEAPIETPVFESPAVEETVEAPAVEETVEAPAIEEEVVLAPVEVTPIEVPAIEEVVEAPVEEEPAVEIAPAERNSEPSIISRRSVDPSAVAAILFGY